VPVILLNCLLLQAVLGFFVHDAEDHRSLTVPAVSIDMELLE